MATFINTDNMRDEKHTIYTSAENLVLIHAITSKTNTIDRRPELPDCDRKYWKADGDFISEMDAGEKAVVDQAEADAAAAQLSIQQDIDNMEHGFKTFAKLVFSEINKLRVKNGDAEYTWTQFKTAFKNEW